MKAALLAAVAMYGAVQPPDSGVEAFRYERALTAPAGASGQACATLDAAVFAHAGSQTLDDLRIYSRDGAGNLAPVPFNFSINDTQTTEDDAAPVTNLHGANGVIDFDLKMPQRPHSSVTLDLAAKDFMGTAVVSGMMTPDGPRTMLGTFPIYDLASQHLSRSTTLPLQETSFPLLHLQLRLKSNAASTTPIGTSIVHGAMVPPSRQAQRIYSAVATTNEFHREGRDTVATLYLPEHVPAERVSFAVPPEYRKNFERKVEVLATPDGAAAGSSETVPGEISRIDLAPSGVEPMPINSQITAIETAFAANFQAGATIRVVIHNADQSPLPLSAVNVEMRQRKICFDANPSAQYALMYGAQDGMDEHAPSLPFDSHPAAAQMGPELPNKLYASRTPRRGLIARQPDLLWTCSAAVLAILGSITLRRRRIRRS